MAATSTMKVRVFDGAGQVFAAGTDVLLTVTDGNQKQILRSDFNSGQVDVTGLPFYDNLGDHYSVVAYVKGYKQAGYFPVKLSPESPQEVDLMLIPNDATFNFAGLDWAAAKAMMPFLAAQPEGTDAAAEADFTTMLETNGSRPLACMMNLVAAMRGLDLEGKTPVDYLRQVRWDSTFPAQDRFFAYCDAGLVDAVKAAAARGEWAPEPGAGLFHPGATLSWKQVRFPEANVQLTFHTNAADTVPGKGWVTVEPDIDYYKNLLDHGILEVARNKVTGSLTEPAQVFVLRWMEHRRMGLPDFAPGYTIR